MFKGSIVAIVTPFDQDQNIDFKKLGELIEWHIESKTDGIVILGTTGEAATLSKEEKLEVFKYTVQKVNKRIPVIAGTGSNNTLQTISFSREVEKLGVDGLLIVTPYYNKANKEGFIKHYEMIANSVNTPIMMYNVPSRTGCSLPVDVVVELSKHQNIVALKEASGDISYFAQVASLVSDDFLLFSGNDDMVLPLMSLGASGVVSVAANVIPFEFHLMVERYLQCDIKEAKRIQLEYLELINTLFIETNPIPVKAVLKLMGKIDGNYRLPLCQPSQEAQQKINSVFNKYDL